MHRLHIVVFLLIVQILLVGCATATRGGSTMLIVETTPVGARVDTTVPSKGMPKLNKFQIRKIKRGKMAQPEFSYRYCEPTPCGIEVPRKLELDILITKDGYAPQTHTIGYLHRKQIAKETARNTAIAAAGAGATGAAAMGSMASALAGGVTAGSLVAGAAVFAAPVLLVGAIANGVDSSTGANYDYWPNPALAELIELPNEESANANSQAIIQEFKEKQRLAVLTIEPSVHEKRVQKAKQKEKLRKQEKAKRIAAKRAKAKLKKEQREADKNRAAQ